MLHNRYFYGVVLCIQLVILSIPTSLHAQVLADSTECFAINDSSYYLINTVDIQGLKRTRKKIILREIDLYANTLYRGDSLKELLKWNRNKIFNTLLFTTVNSEFVSNDVEEGFDVNFIVQERWYTFPIPILEIADRNINEWWSDRNRDLTRVDYGLGFNQFNFTGRNDFLKILLQGGFTQKFEGFYRLPYIDRMQKNGITLGASYSTNKNVAFATQDNKLEFTGNLDQELRERFYATLQFVHRSKYYSFQRAELRYNRNRIADTIALLNPNYFLGGSTFQEYISFSVQYAYDKRDMAPYPLKGKFYQVTADAAGLGLSKNVEIYSLIADYAHYWKLNEHWYFGSKLRAKGSLPGPQAYFLQRGLGYGSDLVRGFERNVIDGQQALLTRNSLRKRIYSTVFDWGKLSPLDQFKVMPLALYLKTFFDAGYVQDARLPPGNALLANKLIYSGGLGLDIVTYYDVVFRMEYSLNSLGNTGLFLHFMADI